MAVNNANNNNAAADAAAENLAQLRAVAGMIIGSAMKDKARESKQYLETIFEDTGDEEGIGAKKGAGLV